MGKHNVTFLLVIILFSSIQTTQLEETEMTSLKLAELKEYANATYAPVTNTQSAITSKNGIRIYGCTDGDFYALIAGVPTRIALNGLIPVAAPNDPFYLCQADSGQICGGIKSTLALRLTLINDDYTHTAISISFGTILDDVNTVYRIWSTATYALALIKKDADSHYYMVRVTIADGTVVSTDLGTSPMIPGLFTRSTEDKIDLMFYITDGMYFKAYDISANTLGAAGSRYTTTNLAAHADCLNGFVYNQNIGYLVVEGATASTVYKTMKFYLDYTDQSTILSQTISDYRIYPPNDCYIYNVDYFMLGWEVTSNRIYGFRNQGHLMLPLFYKESIIAVGGDFIFTSGKVFVLQPETAPSPLGNVGSPSYAVDVKAYTQIDQGHIILYDTDDTIVSIGSVTGVEYQGVSIRLQCIDLIKSQLDIPYPVVTFTTNIGFSFFAIFSQTQGFYIDLDRSSADPFNGINYFDNSTVTLRTLMNYWSNNTGYDWVYTPEGAICLNEAAYIASINAYDETQVDSIVSEKVALKQIGVIRLFGKGITSEKFISNGTKVLPRYFPQISDQTILDAIRDNIDESGDVKTISFETHLQMNPGEEFSYDETDSLICLVAEDFRVISANYNGSLGYYTITAVNKYLVDISEELEERLRGNEDRVATLETLTFIPLRLYGNNWVVSLGAYTAAKLDGSSTQFATANGRVPKSIDVTQTLYIVITYFWAANEGTNRDLKIYAETLAQGETRGGWNIANNQTLTFTLANASVIKRVTWMIQPQLSQSMIS